MKSLDLFLQKYAKQYHTLPVEMKLLVGIILFVLILVTRIREAIFSLATTLKGVPRKNTEKKNLSKQKRTPFRFQPRHLLRLKPALRMPLHLRKRKVVSKKRSTVFRHTHIAPIRLRTKLKYVAIGGFLAFFFLFLPLLILIFLENLPHPTELTTRQIPQTTKIFDRNGELLAEIYSSQNRTIVPLSSIPRHLQQATLAIEDKNFYKHPGFDLASIIRAAKENLSGKPLQGGSTITQQLVKSSILTPEKQFSRKVKELVIAFWAERIYTKNQILEMYFNQIPYGGTAWGIEAASEVYFGKNVRDLKLSESAFLAGVTAAPTTYSPFGEYPDLWKRRQKEVLHRMLALGYISKKQADEAAKETLAFKPQQTALHAPHFVEYVKRQLARKYGIALLEKGGLHVITTLDLTLQERVQKIVSEEVSNNRYLNLTNGAALVTDPKTGEILAMVGSHDFKDEKYGNVNITTSYRQPGSSVKVITYSAALANGMTAATIVDDSPQTFPIAGSTPYTPVNYDGRYRGRVPLRTALANSLNLPAVKLVNQVGVDEMVQLAKDMGIASWGDPSEYGLSITLGAAEVTMLDMATVNGTLANGGKRVNLDPFKKVSNATGLVLYRRQLPVVKEVLPESVAFIISDILSDNQARSMAFGPASPLHIPGHKVAVKTGTSDNKRDNHAIGYTNNYVVAVWVGNNDNTPMSPQLASGITGAAPIWNRIMTTLLTKNPEKPFSKPQEVVQKLCFGRPEYFVKGTENNALCGPQVYPSPIFFTDQSERRRQNRF